MGHWDAGFGRGVRYDGRFPLFVHRHGYQRLQYDG